VAAITHRVHHILSNGGTDQQLICDVFQANAWILVQSSENFNAAQMAAKTPKLPDHGIDLDMIGAHSLRTGGIIALKSWDMRTRQSENLGAGHLTLG